MQKMTWLVGLLVAFAMQCGVAAAGQKNDCYPGNGVLTASGPTSASGEAERTLTEIEVNRHGLLSDLMPVGGAEVEVEFDAAITGLNTAANDGTSTGRLKIEINWNTPIAGGITETEFESGCVQEIGTAGGAFEAEYEGTVENFPGYPGTSKAAVASIKVKPDSDNPGKLELDVVIELGYTCFEEVYTTTPTTGEGNDIEFESIALKGLDPAEFSIGSGTHGRVSLPDQRTAATCPGTFF